MLNANVDCKGMQNTPLIKRGIFGKLIAFARLTAQQALEQQSCPEPVWSVIQADDMVYIPSASAVIPRTESVPGKQAAREIFGGKDDSHISQPAKPGRSVSQNPAHGGNDGGTAVNGKHPDRGHALQGKVTAAERAQGGEENFHAPPDESAFQKISCKGCSVMLHDVSLSFCRKTGLLKIRMIHFVQFGNSLYNKFFI